MKKIFYLLTLLLISACGGGNTPTKPTTPSNPIPDLIETKISRFDIRFNTSTFDGWETIESACVESGNTIPVYISGHYTNLDDAYLDGKKIYKDSILSEVLKSDNKWFKTGDNIFTLSTDGSITQLSKCN